MPRLLATLLVLLLARGTPAAAAVPSESRGWFYGAYTLAGTQGWSFTVMPGFRYEFADSEAEPSGMAMHELFAGPSRSWTWGRTSLTLPLWYYYMGFRAGDDLYWSHNVELIPTVQVKADPRLAFKSRTILHNKVHASNPLFTEPSQRNGYSLLLRQMLTIRVAPNPSGRCALTLSEEAFLGLVEDPETRDLAKGEPFFERRGFSMNRVYLGIERSWKLGDAALLLLAPQYVLETHHDPALSRVRHQAFLTAHVVQSVGRRDP